VNLQFANNSLRINVVPVA
jgi:hypothetical protein